MNIFSLSFLWSLRNIYSKHQYPNRFVTITTSIEPTSVLTGCDVIKADI